MTTLPNTPQAPPSADAFVNHLYGLATRPDSRPQLMRLRSSLGRRDGYAPEAIPLVAPYLPSVSVRDSSGRTARDVETQRRGYYLLGGLFALWHLTNAPERTYSTLGEALRSLPNSTQRDALIREVTSMPRRQADNVLLRAVTALAQNRIAFNWSDLAHALTGNDRMWTSAQRLWAEKFYASVHH